MTAPVPLVERLAEATLGARCTACGHEAGDHSWYGPCLASDKNGEFCPCRHSREHVYARALLPVVEQAVTGARGEVLRDMAREIESGPTFPIPPSIVAALVRERADAIATTETGEKGPERGATGAVSGQEPSGAVLGHDEGEA